MITLNLLHPLQSIPIQSWTFEQESLIRIGRATDNDVILYSAVVSRHHVELRLCQDSKNSQDPKDRQDSKWEVINLGANGTYLEGKRINQAPITDGVMIRLARSGPQIQIHLGSSGTKDEQNTTSQKPATSQKPGSGESKPEKSRDTLIYPKGEQKKEDN